MNDNNKNSNHLVSKINGKDEMLTERLKVKG